MRRLRTRLVLAVLAAFVAISAIPSAVLVVPTLPTDWLARGPFSDYTIPAIALGVLVGWRQRGDEGGGVAYGA